MFLFLLDLNHYLGNLTFIFRFREIYLLLQDSSGRLPILNVFTISPKERISIQRRFDENTNLRGSYYKAPMVTLIETERGIDPSRFNGWHEIWTNSPSGEFDGVLDPTRHFGEIACVILLGKMASRTGPTNQNGEQDCLCDPTCQNGEHVAADDILYGAYTCGISEDARILAKRQILGSRIRVFDTMPRDVRGAVCWV
ncbi:hypothetical protein F2Q69_00053463 [Brassica cretica]|uniref:Uncharacterized protein n=1 Tax=Brassica cretica TaxID=69181 RepID=A0A8S9N591_BRACR|nr:hypothetical protein F2Q69_00053463 [Brassica cretica]